MLEKYEEIFWQVAEELGINEWWFLFDSENFDLVEQRCRTLPQFDEELFDKWNEEMAWDL